MKTLIWLLLIYFVGKRQALVERKLVPISDNTVLTKILKSVDAANSHEHLFDVTLRLLRSLCVCMRETLRENQDSFIVDDGTNTLQVDEHVHSTDVFSLYRKIYNNTCFNLRQELASKINSTRIATGEDDEESFLEHTKCGKRITNELEEALKSPVQNIKEGIRSKLHHILYKALIDTRDIHKYRIRRRSLFGKAQPRVARSSSHSVIVILTFHPTVSGNKTISESETIEENELNETLNSQSIVDIDIMDAKYDDRNKESEELINNDIVLDCHLQSVFTFLIECEKQNMTKVFRLLRKNSTIKIYIDVVTLRNHTDYSTICCENGQTTVTCKKHLIKKQDKSVNSLESTELALQPDRNQTKYEHALSQIKNWVKQYEQNVQSHNITLARNRIIEGLTRCGNNISCQHRAEKKIKLSSRKPDKTDNSHKWINANTKLVNSKVSQSKIRFRDLKRTGNLLNEIVPLDESTSNLLWTTKSYLVINRAAIKSIAGKSTEHSDSKSIKSKVEEDVTKSHHNDSSNTQYTKAVTNHFKKNTEDLNTDIFQEEIDNNAETTRTTLSNSSRNSKLTANFENNASFISSYNFTERAPIGLIYTKQSNSNEKLTTGFPVRTLPSNKHIFTTSTQKSSLQKKTNFSSIATTNNRLDWKTKTTLYQNNIAKPTSERVKAWKLDNELKFEHLKRNLSTLEPSAKSLQSKSVFHPVLITNTSQVTPQYSYVNNISDNHYIVSTEFQTLLPTRPIPTITSTSNYGNIFVEIMSQEKLTTSQINNIYTSLKYPTGIQNKRTTTTNKLYSLKERNKLHAMDIMVENASVIPQLTTSAEISQSNNTYVLFDELGSTLPLKQHNTQSFDTFKSHYDDITSQYTTTRKSVTTEMLNDIFSATKIITTIKPAKEKQGEHFAAEANNLFTTQVSTYEVSTIAPNNMNTFTINEKKRFESNVTRYLYRNGNESQEKSITTALHLPINTPVKNRVLTDSENRIKMATSYKDLLHRSISKKTIKTTDSDITSLQDKVPEHLTLSYKDFIFATDTELLSTADTYILPSIVNDTREDPMPVKTTIPGLLEFNSELIKSKDTTVNIKVHSVTPIQDNNKLRLYDKSINKLGKIRSSNGSQQNNLKNIKKPKFKEALYTIQSPILVETYTLVTSDEKHSDKNVYQTTQKASTLETLEHNSEIDDERTHQTLPYVTIDVTKSMNNVINILNTSTSILTTDSTQTMKFTNLLTSKRYIRTGKAKGRKTTKKRSKMVTENQTKYAEETLNPFSFKEEVKRGLHKFIREPIEKYPSTPSLLNVKKYVKPSKQRSTVSDAKRTIKTILTPLENKHSTILQYDITSHPKAFNLMTERYEVSKENLNTPKRFSIQDKTAAVLKVNEMIGSTLLRSSLKTRMPDIPSYNTATKSFANMENMGTSSLTTQPYQRDQKAIRQGENSSVTTGYLLIYTQGYKEYHTKSSLKVSDIERMPASIQSAKTKGHRQKVSTKLTPNLQLLYEPTNTYNVADQATEINRNSKYVENLQHTNKLYSINISNGDTEKHTTNINDEHVRDYKENNSETTKTLLPGSIQANIKQYDMIDQPITETVNLSSGFPLPIKANISNETTLMLKKYRWKSNSLAQKHEQYLNYNYGLEKSSNKIKQNTTQDRGDIVFPMNTLIDGETLNVQVLPYSTENLHINQVDKLSLLQDHTRGSPTKTSDIIYKISNNMSIHENASRTGKFVLSGKQSQIRSKYIINTIVPLIDEGTLLVSPTDQTYRTESSTYTTMPRRSNTAVKINNTSETTKYSKNNKHDLPSDFNNLKNMKNTAKVYSETNVLHKLSMLDKLSGKKSESKAVQTMLKYGINENGQINSSKNYTSTLTKVYDKLGFTTNSVSNHYSGTINPHSKTFLLSDSFDKPDLPQMQMKSQREFSMVVSASLRANTNSTTERYNIVENTESNGKIEPHNRQLSTSNRALSFPRSLNTRLARLDVMKTTKFALSSPTTQNVMGEMQINSHKSHSELYEPIPQQNRSGIKDMHDNIANIITIKNPTATMFHKLATDNTESFVTKNKYSVFTTNKFRSDNASYTQEIKLLEGQHLLNTGNDTFNTEQPKEVAVSLNSELIDQYNAYKVSAEPIHTRKFGESLKRTNKTSSTVADNAYPEYVTPDSDILASDFYMTRTNLSNENDELRVTNTLHFNENSTSFILSEITNSSFTTKIPNDRIKMLRETLLKSHDEVTISPTSENSIIEEEYKEYQLQLSDNGSISSTKPIEEENKLQQYQIKTTLRPEGVRKNITVPYNKTEYWQDTFINPITIPMEMNNYSSIPVSDPSNTVQMIENFTDYVNTREINGPIVPGNKININIDKKWHDDLFSKQDAIKKYKEDLSDTNRRTSLNISLSEYPENIAMNKNKLLVSPRNLILKSQESTVLHKSNTFEDKNQIKLANTMQRGSHDFTSTQSLIIFDRFNVYSNHNKNGKTATNDLQEKEASRTKIATETITKRYIEGTTDMKESKTVKGRLEINPTLKNILKVTSISLNLMIDKMTTTPEYRLESFNRSDIPSIFMKQLSENYFKNEISNSTLTTKPFSMVADNNLTITFKNEASKLYKEKRTNESTSKTLDMPTLTTDNNRLRANTSNYYWNSFSERKKNATPSKCKPFVTNKYDKSIEERTGETTNVFTEAISGQDLLVPTKRNDLLLKSLPGTQIETVTTLKNVYKESSTELPSTDCYSSEDPPNFNEDYFTTETSVSRMYTIKHNDDIIREDYMASSKYPEHNINSNNKKHTKSRNGEAIHNINDIQDLTTGNWLFKTKPAKIVTDYIKNKDHNDEKPSFPGSQTSAAVKTTLTENPVTITDVRHSMGQNRLLTHEANTSDAMPLKESHKLFITSQDISSTVRFLPHRNLNETYNNSFSLTPKKYILENGMYKISFNNSITTEKYMKNEKYHTYANTIENAPKTINNSTYKMGTNNEKSTVTSEWIPAHFTESPIRIRTEINTILKLQKLQKYDSEVYGDRNVHISNNNNSSSSIANSDTLVATDENFTEKTTTYNTTNSYLIENNSPVVQGDAYKNQISSPVNMAHRTQQTDPNIISTVDVTTQNKVRINRTNIDLSTSTFPSLTFLTMFYQSNTQKESEKPYFTSNDMTEKYSDTFLQNTRYSKMPQTNSRKNTDKPTSSSLVKSSQNVYSTTEVSKKVLTTITGSRIETEDVENHTENSYAINHSNARTLTSSKDNIPDHYTTTMAKDFKVYVTNQKALYSSANLSQEIAEPHKSNIHSNSSFTRNFTPIHFETKELYTMSNTNHRTKKSEGVLTQNNMESEIYNSPYKNITIVEANNATQYNYQQEKENKGHTSQAVMNTSEDWSLKSIDLPSKETDNEEDFETIFKELSTIFSDENENAYGKHESKNLFFNNHKSTSLTTERTFKKYPVERTTGLNLIGKHRLITKMENDYRNDINSTSNKGFVITLSLPATRYSFKEYIGPEDFKTTTPYNPSIRVPNKLFTKKVLLNAPSDLHNRVVTSKTSDGIRLTSEKRNLVTSSDILFFDKAIVDAKSTPIIKVNHFKENTNMQPNYNKHSPRIYKIKQNLQRNPSTLTPIVRVTRKYRKIIYNTYKPTTEEQFDYMVNGYNVRKNKSKMTLPTLHPVVAPSTCDVLKNLNRDLIRSIQEINRLLKSNNCTEKYTKSTNNEPVKSNNAGVMMKNIWKPPSNKERFLDPYAKINLYPVKEIVLNRHGNLMRRIPTANKKDLLTMNTQDFFSKRLVTPTNMEKDANRHQKPMIMRRPATSLPRHLILKPQFNTIDKPLIKDRYFRPKPLFIKKDNDFYRDGLRYQHHPQGLSWKERVGAIQNAINTQAAHRDAVGLAIERPMVKESALPRSKYLRDRVDSFRNYVYKSKYVRPAERPSNLESVFLDTSDESDEHSRPQAFQYKINTARYIEEEPRTTTKRTRRKGRTLFFLSPTVTAWWLDDMYLKVRAPLPINSNPGMVFPRRHFSKMEEVADLGALFIDDLLDYKEMLDRGELPLERATSREKGQALCMEQFYRLLGVCRIPEVGKDRLELPPVRGGEDESEELVVVACRNYFYPIPVKAADRGRLTPGEIQAQLLHVLVDASGAAAAPRVGLLTAMQRDHWARAREQLIRDENNRTNLELISRALCIVCLDEAGGDRADLDPDTNAMLRAMHGAGTRHHSANRWFDKTVQLIISSDGTSGMCYEHSAAEGVAVVRLTERALARAEVAARPAPPPVLLPAPQPMKWHLTADLLTTIDRAANDLDRAICDLDFKVYTYRGYGREYMKACRTSPDVYIQLAMQYAYYKMYGHLVTTYESASLRRFRNGRVDNIRSAHSEALAWAAAMCTAETPPLNEPEDGQKKVSFNLYGEQKKLELFEAAARKQASIMEANILGKGIDNHLLALREAAREAQGDLPALFTDDTYKRMIEFKLSTSQVATTTEGTSMGYGAVVPDGYGCSYNPKKDCVIFCISSFVSSSVTNTEAFRQSLEESLDSMKLMFQAKADKADN